MNLFAAETLRIGLYQNPPKIFSDSGGRPAGFFADLLAAIAAREGWQLSYVDCDWDGCLRQLERGEIDLMPDVAYSSERAQRFDFQHEVVLANWSLLYARDRAPFHSILALDNQRIAVITGSIQYQALQRQAQEFNVKPHFVELDSSAATMEAAARGDADAALVNRLYGLQHAAVYGLEATHILVSASHLHFAATPGRHGAILDTIDRQLRAMKEERDSPYYRALQRWVEPLETKTLPPWLLWLAGGLAGVVVVIGLYNLLLKRAVRRTTSALAQRAEELAQSEAMFRTLFENSADAMILARGEELLDVNPAMLRMFGYPDLATLRQRHRDDISPPRQADGENSHEAAERHIRQALESGHAFFEWLHCRADGTPFPAEVTLVPMAVNNQTVLQATIRDISLRRRDEEHLQQLNRALKTLSRVNHTLIHSHDEAGLLNMVCRIIVETGGYRLAWVGFAQYDDPRTVKPVAQYGFETGYLDSLQISWGDNAYGQGPTGTAIRSGNAAVTRDIHNEPSYAPWREQALQRGYASSIALPLLADNSVFGALNIYSAQPDAFDEMELQLLMELAEDLAFGIHNQRMRLEHTHLEEERRGNALRLQEALLQTIQAITAMVEMRDPFTAGHQRRVADLAVAIAKELGLDPLRLEGLHFGGMIHDIGNIYLPAEILNRPGKLTTYELAMIHTHVEVGYNIVKDIDFPWPVAQMILYHHERLDGSGYPAGLQGEAIPLDARIVAVADVAEAMLSHRPYRAALGQEVMLQELQQQRGIRYDAEVVDACLRLFRDKGYTLPV